MSIATGIRLNREPKVPRHGRAEDFLTRNARPAWTTVGAIAALVLAAFGAGNWLGSVSAVDAFTRSHNSPATAPAGYRCWNEIHADAPKGFQQVCGVVQDSTPQ